MTDLYRIAFKMLPLDFTEQQCDLLTGFCYEDHVEDGHGVLWLRNLTKEQAARLSLIFGNEGRDMISENDFADLLRLNRKAGRFDDDIWWLERRWGLETRQGDSEFATIVELCRFVAAEAKAGYRP